MTITDTIDTTVVTLNDVAVLENGAITYTASVEQRAADGVLGDAERTVW